MFKNRKRGDMKDTLDPMSQRSERQMSSFNPSRTLSQRMDEDDVFFGDEIDAVEQSFVTPYASRFVSPRKEEPRWNDLPEVSAHIHDDMLGYAPVENEHRDTPVTKAFDLLRTRLRQAVQQNGWTNIAICSPTPGCGNTFSAVNLALSLSRVPKSKTVLMDFNLRKPGVHKFFDMPERGAMKDYLAGETPMVQHIARISDTLAIGTNDRVDINAAETLQDPTTLRTLDRMRKTLRPDIVIYDMPPLLVHDDLAAFLPQLDGVLLVSDGTRTMAKHIKKCERILEGQVPLVGVILNRARPNSIDSFA